MEYKVTFRDNKAIAATHLNSIENEKLIDLTMLGHKRLMNWLVVIGDNENDAIKMADNIVEVYWANYLNKYVA